MKNPLRRNPIAAAETELANLAARRETLENRRAAATIALEAARAARKNALASDPAVDLTGLTRAVRDGEDEIETLTGVLADLDDQVADAERRLAEAKDGEVRAAAAKTLADVASAVDTAAADLERGLAIVGKAYAALVAAVPETLNVVDLDERVVPPERATSIYPDGVFPIDSYRQPALPNDLARAVLAEGLARVCPMAFGFSSQRGEWRFELRRALALGSERPSFSISDLAEGGASAPATEAATLLISGRLRDRAKHIVAGDMSSNLEDAPVFRPQPKPIHVPAVEVYAIENFAFQIQEGHAHELVAKWWVRLVPEDAADVAVAAGLALRTDTMEGAKAFQDAKARRASNPNGGWGPQGLDRSMCRDLGLIRKAPEPASESERDAA